MDLLVVIVNYKTADYVLDNLSALMPELRAFKGNAKCWVVDNNSPDNSVEILKNAIIDKNLEDFVTLIQHPRNDGFGAGNNVAIQKAMKLDTPPSYIYLLNPDATAAQGTIAKMQRHLEENPNVGVVGGPVYNTDGSYDCGAFRFPSYLSTIEENLSIGLVSALLKNSRITVSPPPADIVNVDWVSGASMMITKNAIQKAGLFDEKFFLYFEEVDLCKRISDRGSEIRYIPDAAVTHVGGVATGINNSSNRLPEYWHQSRRRYYKKSFGTFGLLIHNLMTLCMGSIGYLYKKIRTRPDIRPHYLRDILKYNFLK